MVAKSNIHVAKKRSPGGFSNRVPVAFFVRRRETEAPAACVLSGCRLRLRRRTESGNARCESYHPAFDVSWQPRIVQRGGSVRAGRCLRVLDLREHRLQTQDSDMPILAKVHSCRSPRRDNPGIHGMGVLLFGNVAELVDAIHFGWIGSLAIVGVRISTARLSQTCELSKLRSSDLQSVHAKDLAGSTPAVAAFQASRACNPFVERLRAHGRGCADPAQTGTWSGRREGPSMWVGGSSAVYGVDTRIFPLSRKTAGLLTFCSRAVRVLPAPAAHVFEIPELVFARLGEIGKSQPGPSRWRLSPNPHGESCSLKARTQAAGSATFGSVRDRHASFRAPSQRAACVFCLQGNKRYAIILTRGAKR